MTVQHRQESKQEHHCAWCSKLLAMGEDGVLCWSCRERASIQAHVRASNVVAIPDLPLGQARAVGVPRTLQVLALMEVDGAIAHWTRPDVRAMSKKLHCSSNAIYAALRRLVALGWLERHELGTGKKAYASDYRLALVGR